MGVAEFHHAGALGVFDHAAFQCDGAQFIGRATAWAHVKISGIQEKQFLAVLLGARDGSGKGRKGHADKPACHVAV
jgi:hypothetical protein